MTKYHGIESELMLQTSLIGLSERRAINDEKANRLMSNYLAVRKLFSKSKKLPDTIRPNSISFFSAKTLHSVRPSSTPNKMVVINM